MLDLGIPLSLGCQIIHGDLAESVLVAESLPLAVLDFSLYWRPVGFAAAIVVADAVCWREANPTALLELLSSIVQFPQLLVRALIYRMVTTVAVQQEPDLDGNAPGIDMAMTLVN